MMQKIAQHVVLALAAWLALGLGASANEFVRAPGGASNVVRVGFTEFEPFSHTSTDGLVEGYSIDLLRLLLETTGRTPTFVGYKSPGDMLEGLRQGEIDVTSVLGVNPQREKLGRFTAPVGEIGVDVFVRHDGPEIATAEELAGLRVGVSARAVAERFVAAQEGVMLVRLESGDALLLPLLRGEVDAIAAPGVPFTHAARMAGVLDLVRPTAVRFARSDLALLVRQDRPDLHAVLDAAIAKQTARGAIASLEERWLSHEAPAPFGFSRFEAAGLAVATLALALGLVALTLLGRKFAGMRKEIGTWRAVDEALAANDMSLLILDKALKPVWWSKAYYVNYPKQIPLLEQGTDLPTLIERAHRNGTVLPQLSAEDARALAKDRVDCLMRSGEFSALNNLPDGRCLERRMLMLPSGMCVVIATDVSSLVREREAAELLGQRMAETNARLNDFAKIAAHDLVGPIRSLSRVCGWIVEDLERERGGVPQSVREHIDDAKTLLKRQGAMVADLLEYARSDRNEPRRDFDPVERIRAAIDLANAPPEFSISIPDEMPTLRAGHVAFDIVMRNLLSNAAKHHDRTTGQIRVAHQIVDGMCAIDVIDDGPGIPEDQAERIFQPFVSLKSRDSGGGTGLGLAYVKRTVENWGGSVEVFSMPGRRGSRFRITVQLAEDHPAIEVEDGVNIVLFPGAAGMAG